MRKNKNRVYDYFNMKCYRYAPEMFKMNFNGLPVKINHDDAANLGYYLITGQKEKLTQELKKLCRRQWFNSKPQQKRLAVFTTKKDEYLYISAPDWYGKTDQYELIKKMTWL